MLKLKYKFFVIAIAVFLLQTLMLSGQNLVPNSSFEVVDTCPNLDGQIQFAHGWINANALPNAADYYNVCGVMQFSPPNVVLGYQNPKSGQAFIGLYAYASGFLNAREYAEVQLLDTLIAGKGYYVEFFVVVPNKQRFAITNLGAFFTDSIILTNSSTVISVIPQIENADTSFLTDTLNWMKVSGSFVANGGEKFMTIGNFRTDSATNDTIINPSSGSYSQSYYYIDDVSVIPVDSLQGISDIKPADLLIYPNPVKDILNVKFRSALNKGFVCSLNDLTGKIILRKNFSSVKEIQFDLREYPAGMYFFKCV